VVNIEQPQQAAPCIGASSQMMRSQLVRNYLFIFDRNDGRDREETGQIELSDDHEAFAFGEQVIREMLQGSSRGLRHGGSRGPAHRRSHPLWRIISSLSHLGYSALPYDSEDRRQCEIAAA